MNIVNRREILEKLISGEITIEEAEEKLSTNKIEIVEDIARYDLSREDRTGIPEVIYAETKSSEAIYEIAKNVLKKKPIVLLSRIKVEHIEFIQKLEEDYKLEFGSTKNFCRISHKNHILKKDKGKIGIITAGTSDIPVAEEAKAIAEMMGCEVIIVNDVGVAGIHRLFEPLQKLMKEEIDVLIVAAGMEGALPTVVTGLVDIPVIGLPISTGYGFGGKGETALMSMLQSCALGLAVVNIDGGISAGAIAAKIAKRRCENKD
jgi:NCAIR mutase (PurE)-related protein